MWKPWAYGVGWRALLSRASVAAAVVGPWAVLGAGAVFLLAVTGDSDRPLCVSNKEARLCVKLCRPQGPERGQQSAAQLREAAEPGRAERGRSWAG